MFFALLKSENREDQITSAGQYQTETIHHCKSACDNVLCWPQPAAYTRFLTAHTDVLPKLTSECSTEEQQAQLSAGGGAAHVC